MWHEVRKQERKIRCMIVDYKRRAERRKDYYEKIKADPTQFLQVHGRPCKIHLDPAVAAAGDSPAIMMGWQGGQEIIIDRFDVRAHLDHIPEVKPVQEEQMTYDERQINYERYRILAQNDFLGVSEEKFLHQIYLEEQFGAVPRTGEMPIEGKKKVQGAAIAYNYDDPSAIPAPPPVEETEETAITEENEENEDDSDLDFDMCVDVNKVTTQQGHELNTCGLIYGMEGNDFFSFLTKDKEEAESLRLAKELEEEKAMYSGRKSRRERRAYREKKLAGRKISPPSYASRKSPIYQDYRSVRSSHSRSRSASPINSGQITYITSFGGEEPAPSPERSKSNSYSHKSHGDYSRSVKYRSRSPVRSSRTRNRSSRSPNRRFRSSLKHRRSRSYSRSRSKSRSRSYSKSKHRTRSGSRHRNRSGSRTKHYSNSRYGDTRLQTRRGQSGSRSVSRSKSPAVKTNQKSPSKSKSPIKSAKPEISPTPQIPPPPVMRYYGRYKNTSSSESSDSEDDVEDEKLPGNKNATNNTLKSEPDKKSWPQIGNSSGRNKPIPSAGTNGGGGGPKLTPQERLKKKMQVLLNRQFKADKKAEREKQEKVEQERMDREDEMRELSIKLRKRERMRRHEYFAENRRRSRSSSLTDSSSRSRSPTPPRRERRRRSRSRSSESHRRSKRPLVDY